jgi:hypothetical protein
MAELDEPPGDYTLIDMPAVAVATVRELCSGRRAVAWVCRIVGGDGATPFVTHHRPHPQRLGCGSSIGTARRGAEFYEQVAGLLG